MRDKPSVREQVSNILQSHFKEEAIDAILSLMSQAFEECMPEKKPVTFVSGPLDYQDGFSEGINATIDQFTENWKRLVGGKP